MIQRLIRPARESDAAAICSIYNHYIENSVISFEADLLSVDEMQQRIRTISTDYPWLVYEQDIEGETEITAYAYANLWKTRAAYKHTLETTIYSDSSRVTKGAPSQLYQALFTELEKRKGEQSVHSLMAVIALPNPASVSFHEKMGFEKAGHFREVGRKFEQWIDVGYWQKLF